MKASAAPSEPAAGPAVGPAADLAAAEAARDRLTGSLRLPSWFHTSLGAAVAVQVAGAAYGISAHRGGPGLLAAAAGVVVFVAVAGTLHVRFRRLNRVGVDGLFSRVLMGTSTLSSVVYAVGLGAAVWAAFSDQWLLVALASLACGAAYAGTARLWWRDYLAAPQVHARGESRAALAFYGAAAVVGVVVLVLAR